MRGYVYAQDGELERAEVELRQALAMLTAKRAALYSSQVAVELADVLHKRGKSDEAAALLQDVLSDLSSERGALHSAAAHRLLGIIAEDSRDTDAAEEHYVAPSACSNGRARSATWPTCAACSAICCAAPDAWRRPSTPTAPASATAPPRHDDTRPGPRTAPL